MKKQQTFFLRPPRLLSASLHVTDRRENSPCHTLDDTCDPQGRTFPPHLLCAACERVIRATSSTWLSVREVRGISPCSSARCSRPALVSIPKRKSTPPCLVTVPGFTPHDLPLGGR